MVLRPCGDYGGGGYAEDCFPRSGGHHFYETVKTGTESFRLRGDVAAETAAADPMTVNDDTSSIASKKRIDSMFKATTTTTAATADGEKRTSDYRGYGDGDGNNKNTVQEKIEKMFAEISTSELDTDVSADSAATTGNKYHVQYIGCADLSAKISSLEGLQRPVRDMYFGYRENQHGGHRTANRAGLLEISAAGLTIRYRNGAGDTVHRTDPFPSIAVWAALKYVCRRRPGHPRKNAAGQDGYEYAFLPLIADPDGSDKAPLFRDVDADDRARLDAAGDHAPVFAVVTRKADKRLECHGFACETENDALLMAANLYGALVAAMSSACLPADGDGGATADRRPRTAEPCPRRVIRQRNGFTSMSSTAGSSAGGDDVVAPPALPPPRPPRRNKTKSASSVTSSADGGGEVCSDARTFSMTVRQPPSLRRGVCTSSGSAVDAPEERRAAGDIFTKVAIPRSRSFLNANGLASSGHSRRVAGCGIETAVDRLRRRSDGGGGVMGFSDVFDELRVREGLNNTDDILRAIIDAEGMSYNDMKPVYREFLTKLAMTLTKDELYQRTKAIMTEQKRARHKRRPPGRARRLNDKLRDAFDLRAAKSRIGSVLLPDFCRRDKRAPKFRTPRGRCRCSANSIVFRPVGRRAVASRSTSDDVDPFAATRHRVKLQRQLLLRRQQQQLLLGRESKTRGCGGGNETADGRLHRTSSGYFSCSECSAAEPASLVSCSCDSDSCAESDKCYCGRPRRARNIFDELKSRGFAASESSASRADSPGTAWKKNELMLSRQRHDSDDGFLGGSSSAATGDVEPSKSLEYLRVARRPADRTTTTMKAAAGSSSPSSSSSSLSATTVCSSSLSARRRAHRRPERGRSGSSGSDNFRAIDYALFATDGRKSRGGRQNRHRAGKRAPAADDGRRPPVADRRRSHSSEAVHMTGGCRVYSRQQQQQQQQQQPAARRHSVHDDVSSSSFFKSDIENSLGYYP